MMKLFVEITPTGHDVSIVALAELLDDFSEALRMQEFILLQGHPETRTVLLALNRLDWRTNGILSGELVTAPYQSSLAYAQLGGQNGDVSNSLSRSLKPMAEGPIQSGDKIKITGTYVDPAGSNQTIVIDGTIISKELPEQPPDAGPKK